MCRLLAGSVPGKRKHEYLVMSRVDYDCDWFKKGLTGNKTMSLSLLFGLLRWIPTAYAAVWVIVPCQISL